MATNHSYNSKDYLTAKSLNGLRRKMLELNMISQTKFEFGTPTQFVNSRGNKEFMVWYERPFTKEEIQKILSPTKGK